METRSTCAPLVHFGGGRVGPRTFSRQADSRTLAARSSKVRPNAAAVRPWNTVHSYSGMAIDTPWCVPVTSSAR